MKKTYLFILAALSLAFTACDDTSDLGKAQVNEQQTVMTAGGITISLQSPMSGDAVNFADYEASNVIPVLTYTADETIPENAEVHFQMEIANNDKYENAVAINLEKMGEKDVYGIDMKAWDDAFRSMFGRAPFEKTNYVRIAAFANIGNQVSRLGGVNNWLGAKSINVTPIDLHINVEEAYYLIGTINNWESVTTAVKFNHSDLNQFDDPVFSLAVDIPVVEGGWWWKIVPQSSYEANSWDGLYGTETNGDESLEGVLIPDGQAGKLTVAGQYLFSINMLDCTYSVSLAIPMLYTPGAGNGWGFGSGMLNTWDFSEYFGFATLGNSFKVTDRPQWGGIEWGAGNEEGKLQLGGGNIDGPGEGLYWMTVNISSLTYSWLKINSIGIIGGFTDNNWATDIPLTPSEDLLVWKAEITFNEGTEWKFRTNGDWGANPNLGGEFDNLTRDGGNLPVPAEGAGTYEVTLDITTVPYHVTFVKK